MTTPGWKDPLGMMADAAKDGVLVGALARRPWRRVSPLAARCRGDIASRVIARRLRSSHAAPRRLRLDRRLRGYARRRRFPRRHIAVHRLPAAEEWAPTSPAF